MKKKIALVLVLLMHVSISSAMSRAQGIAQYFQRPLSEVTSLRLQGYGHKEIVKILVIARLSGRPLSVLVEKNSKGQSWGVVAAELGLDAVQVQQHLDRSSRDIEALLVAPRIVDKEPLEKAPVIPPVPPPVSAKADNPSLPSRPLVQSRTFNDFVLAYNTFVLDLFIGDKEVSEGTRNVMFSPPALASALWALSMTVEAERKPLWRNLLHISSFSEEEVVGFSRLFQKGLADVTRESSLKLAKSLWVSSFFSLNESWSQQAADFFALPSFRFNPNEVGTIRFANEWAMRQTEDVITVMLNSWDRNAESLLLSTVFYQNLADETFTSEPMMGRFYFPKVVSRLVPRMSRNGPFLYKDFGDVEMIQWPFGPNPLRASIVLGRNDLSLEKTLSWLRRRPSGEWPTLSTFTNGRVILPRLYVTARTNWVPSLLEQGFKPASKPALSYAMQSVFFRFEEKRTTFQPKTAAFPEDSTVRPFLMDVDRPFLFVLHDTSTGALLLMAAVRNPYEPS